MHLLSPSSERCTGSQQQKGSLRMSVYLSRGTPGPPASGRGTRGRGAWVGGAHGWEGHMGERGTRVGGVQVGGVQVGEA